MIMLMITKGLIKVDYERDEKKDQIFLIALYCQFSQLEQFLKQMNNENDTTHYQSNLTYYKGKVELLETERQNWLSKFDECSEKLKQKQEKEEMLRSLKDQNDEAEKDILHHRIACFDENLSSLNLDRTNQNLEFQEAEQLVKLRELAEEYPAAVGYLEKVLPCTGSLSGDLIQNDLNLHSNSKPKSNANKNSSKNPHASKISLQKEKNVIKPLTAPKKTLDQLLKIQIFETKKLNEKQLQIMGYQEELLEESIREYKQKQGRKVNNERKVVQQFNKKYKELEQKHKKLAEGYFEFRRKHKQRIQNTRKQHQNLKSTYSSLEEKVNQEIKVYEKENKAKQALILRKSEDFQEDYKAKMRAKERNLQALKENYEKMQEMCIEKVRKLEATVERAGYQLKDTEEKRNFLLSQLREQLRDLQKRCNEQRIQKAKLDIKIKKQLEAEKLRMEEEKEEEENHRKQLEREELLKTAYKKTGLPKRTMKKKSKENNKGVVNNAQSSGDEDSLQISDIENIRKQINDLEKKIASDER